MAATNKNLAWLLPVTCVCCYTWPLLNVRYICVCLLTINSLAGVKVQAAHWEQEGWERRCLPCSQAAMSSLGSSPQSPCPAGRALAQPCAPGLGTGSVYVMKGSRRWLFLSFAFPHTCAGPGPAWKLCPHEWREGDGRSERWRGAQKQRELK